MARMPLITTKRVYWKTATREMLWVPDRRDQYPPAWCSKASISERMAACPLFRVRPERTFRLEAFVARIAEDEDFAVQWGDLGAVYGKQWVDWTTYEPNGDGSYRKGRGSTGRAGDRSLRTNPGSRRHIIEGWNVAELDRMALPPCHKTYSSTSRAGGSTACSTSAVATSRWACRSTSVGRAAPADDRAAGGLEPGELVWVGGDTHLYLNHGALVEEQLSRTPSGEPRLDILRKPETIFDYRIEDFEVRNYTPQAAIKAPIAV